VEFATELPKTATGKIQRFRVREMMLDRMKSEVLQ
jgi:acyl-coenzyme A synthetase/AMP-(fatty) acid ligase